MDNEALPDHYKALGLDKTCDTEAVKKAHRKLVLHCHPDKVKDTDPLKEEKQAQFHVVQKAYEVLTDAKERAKYEALLTLQALRKEKLARGAAEPAREKTARFDVRTAGGATYQANGPSRYATEERRPSRTYDEDEKYYDDRDRERERERERERTRASTRSKYDTYDAYPKPGASPRTEKESSRAAKATTDRSRADRNKARDKEERRERKFVSVDSESSSADEKARHEAGYKRRSQEDEARRRDAESRRKADDRRSYEDTRYGASSSARKLSTQEEEAIRYLHKSRAQVEEAMRPTPVRTSSKDYYGESRSSRKESSRPETVRRSSARPKDRVSSSSARDKGYPEIVSWGEDERRPPTLKPYSSSPANIEIPTSRTMPQRSFTAAEPPARDHHSPTSPPGLLRSQTMPTNGVHPSSRSKPAAVPRPSTFRETMSPEHSPDHEYARIPPPESASKASTKYYHYPTPVPHPEELAGSGHRTVLREPERQRHLSPDPLKTRPPIGVNRPSEANIKLPGRTSRHASPERGRLYGEVRPRAARQSSYAPNDVHYAPKYGPEDVRWAPRKGENDSSRGFENGPKPQFMRTPTYAY